MLYSGLRQYKPSNLSVTKFGGFFLSIMVKLSRKLHYECLEDAEVRKAIALLLFCKRNTNNSTIMDFSFNKLHNMTGLHYVTLRKRMATLEGMELIMRHGKEKRNLSFLRVHRSNDRNNILFPDEELKSVKDYEDALLSLTIVETQRHKEYVHKLINTLEHSHDYKEVKKARRKVNSEYGGVREFVDNGISYKYLSKKMGVSLQKAFQVVKFAVEKKFVKLKKNFEQIFSRGVGYYLNKSNSIYTFSTKNNIYLIKANSYQVLFS